MSSTPQHGWLGAVFLLLVVAAFTVSAADVPYLTGRVVDNAEILSPETRRALEEKLAAHERATTNQVVVLTLESLEGESIEDFAVHVFEQWKLGQQGKDNGVLLVVVPGERRLRIEVGYGLEGTLTDIQAGRIIRDIVTPRFRDGDYNGGIGAGVAAIVTLLEGGRLPAEMAGEENRETDDKPAFLRRYFGRSAACSAHSLRGLHLRHHRPLHRHRRADARGGLVPLFLPDPLLGHVSHDRRRGARRPRPARYLLLWPSPLPS